MHYKILFFSDAIDDLRAPKTNARAKIQDAIKAYLCHEPGRESKSRFKRLKGLSSPPYRLRALKANARTKIQDAIKAYLCHAPGRESKRRIKRLKGLSNPQYRLRVNEFRVYYDITDNTVEVIAIASKAGSESWLEKEGVKKCVRERKCLCTR